MKNRQWLLARRPQGAIQDSDFNFVETDVPTLEQTLRNLFRSSRPTMTLSELLWHVSVASPLLGAISPRTLTRDRHSLASGEIKTAPIRANPTRQATPNNARLGFGAEWRETRAIFCIPSVTASDALELAGDS